MDTKKILFVWVCILCTCQLKAYDFTVNGIYYNFLSGTDEVEVTSGYGNLYQGNIVIPESVVYESKTYCVTTIGGFAFSSAKLTMLTLPNTITTLKAAAFAGINLLPVLNLPVSVTTIENPVFFGSNITAIQISEDNQFFTSENGVLYSKDKTTLLAYPVRKTETVFSVPESITSIESSAFSYCSSLTSITIPNSVTSIGSNAFSYCSSLTSITIPNSVTSIRSEAFYWCNSLTSITIPNSVTSIENGAFSYCGSLTSITIPNSVTSIGSNVFSYCSNLTSIIIPNSVTSIRSEAFYGCRSLTLITIPNSVISIGSNAFRACHSLTSITIPNSVTSIGDSAFSYCSSLTSITIPNSVTSIRSEAFYGCRSLTSITIPNSVTSIGNFAFFDCSSLTSITIPNSVTSIGSYAFYGCKFSVIAIPNSVTKIRGNAFNNKNLIAIEVAGDNPNYSSVDGILYDKDKTRLECYPEGKNETTFTVPGSVKTIGEDVFYGNQKLASILLPEGLESIERYAFSSCIIKDIVLPNSLKEIGYASFEYSRITSITIPASVEYISDWAFTKCPDLESIVFEGPVQRIESNIFAGYYGFPRIYQVEVKCEPFAAVSNGCFDVVDMAKSTLIVPDGTKSLFEAANVWKDFGTIVEKTQWLAIPPVQAKTEIFISGDMLYVNTPVKETVSVYSIAGGQLFSTVKPAGEKSVNIEAIRDRILIVTGSSGWVRKVAK